jgi:GT2 family glycosyltransferase
MKILTCLVTYNRLPLTKRCVESYLATVGPDSMLVIVDNGSTDGTCEWLAQFPNVIYNGGNLYPGRACNQGWDHGLNTGFGPDLLHRLDNDIELLPGWREEVERAFTEWPELALLGVLNLHEDRKVDAHAEHGIEPVPRVGGNVVMPAANFRAGLRWSEQPWRPQVDEDGPMSWEAARYGIVARLRRTVANNMAFCRAEDFPDYYRETARVRGIKHWETST